VRPRWRKSPSGRIVGACADLAMLKVLGRPGPRRSPHGEGPLRLHWSHDARLPLIDFQGSARSAPLVLTGLLGEHAANRIWPNARPFAASPNQRHVPVLQRRFFQAPAEGRVRDLGCAVSHPRQPGARGPPQQEPRDGFRTGVAARHGSTASNRKGPRRTVRPVRLRLKTVSNGRIRRPMREP
jgi:hypothetical protein